MSAIRPATIGDLAAMARLHAECFTERWDEKSLSELIVAPGSFALIGGRDGGAEGFILIRVVADEAEILSIGVTHDARRHGLASDLLQAAGTEAAQLGAGQMFLEVVTDNEPAKSLYENRGFRPVGLRKAYYQGNDALILKAALPLGFRMGKAEKTL